MTETHFLPRGVIILCVFTLLLISYTVSWFTVGWFTVDQRYHSGPKLQGTPPTSETLSNQRLKSLPLNQCYEEAPSNLRLSSDSSKPSTSGALSNHGLKPLPVDQSYEEAPSDFHLSSDSPTSEQWSHNTSAHRRRYLFFMEINEKLSANMEKFFQLSYFSALWNFKMVEPWIDKNTECLSSLPPTGKSVLYLDLYNRTALPKNDVFTSRNTTY